MPKKIAKGFTLIELLVVVAIIGILSTMGVVAYNKYTKIAQTRAIKTQNNEIHDFSSEFLDFSSKFHRFFYESLLIDLPCQENVYIFVETIPF